MIPEVGEHLPRFEVLSKNYGADHANRIHSDEGAARYGFAGALVPGVAVYGYMTRPVVEALGRDWLARGSMSAKFLKPVYDAQLVAVDGTVESKDPPAIALELRNPGGELCAVGLASLPAELPKLDGSEYPEPALPAVPRPATIEAVRPGEIFGSIEFIFDPVEQETGFLPDMVDDSEIYRGPGAACHPSWWIAKANEIIMRNVALGPWIHTASDLQQYDPARAGERLSMRGRVVEAFEKRGHEIIRLDLGVFGEGGRPIARILHSAIIKIG